MAKLDIYKRALSLVGDTQGIDALADSHEVPYRDQCDIWYGTARERAFESANWWFCRTFEELVVADTDSWITNPNVNKYPHVYVWNDPDRYVLQFVEYPNRNRVMRNELNYVLGYQAGTPPANNTNWYALSMRDMHSDYVTAAWSDMQFDEDDYPNFFVDAVAGHLAVLIAHPIYKNNLNKIKPVEYRAMSLVMYAVSKNDNAEYANSSKDAVDRYTAASLYGYEG